MTLEEFLQARLANIYLCCLHALVAFVAVVSLCVTQVMNQLEFYPVERQVSS